MNEHVFAFFRDAANLRLVAEIAAEYDAFKKEVLKLFLRDLEGKLVAQLDAADLLGGHYGGVENVNAAVGGVR